MQLVAKGFEGVSEATVLRCFAGGLKGNHRDIHFRCLLVLDVRRYVVRKNLRSEVPCRALILARRADALNRRKSDCQLQNPESDPIQGLIPYN